MKFNWSEPRRGGFDVRFRVAPSGTSIDLSPRAMAHLGVVVGNHLSVGTSEDGTHLGLRKSETGYKIGALPKQEVGSISARPDRLPGLVSGSFLPGDPRLVFDEDGVIAILIAAPAEQGGEDGAA